MDEEYVISEYVKDGLLFEMIISQTDVAVAESGEVGPVIAQPRVRITALNAPNT